MTVGDRGTAAILLPLPWGPDDGLIDVYSDELADGRSISKIGLTAMDPAAKLLAAMLSNCYLAKVMRANTGGSAATATETGLTVSAKYAGTLGNKITVAVEPNDLLFRVTTFVDGIARDSQIVAEIEELEANDYVTFSGTGAPPISAGIALAGGTDGAYVEATRYAQYFNALKTAFWQVAAVTTDTPAIKNATVAFVETLRDRQGRYVQAVVPNYSAADHEGVVSVLNSCDIDGVDFTPAEAAALVAGLMAGTPIASNAARSASNTGYVIRGATKIAPELEEDAIKAALQSGHIVFTRNQSGAVKIEQDINSLNTFTPEKGRMFRKNRVVRTLDEIGTTAKSKWEDSYMGRVSNDEDGRAMFRADMVSYLTELQRIGAIQGFAGSEDVQVSQGDNPDSVLCVIRVTPVDSMEFLYLTCVMAA